MEAIKEPTASEAAQGSEAQRLGNVFAVVCNLAMRARPGPVVVGVPKSYQNPGKCITCDLQFTSCELAIDNLFLRTLLYRVCYYYMYIATISSKSCLGSLPLNIRINSCHFASGIFSISTFKYCISRWTEARMYSLAPRLSTDKLSMHILGLSVPIAVNRIDSTTRTSIFTLSIQS